MVPADDDLSVLRLRDARHLSLADFESRFAGRTVEIAVRFSALGNCNSCLDLADGYLTAFYVAERLALFSRLVGWSTGSLADDKSKYRVQHFFLEFQDIAVSDFHAELIQLALLEGDAHEDDACDSARERRMEWIATVEDDKSFVPVCPELGDLYHAHLLDGMSDLDDEAQEELRSEFPENDELHVLSFHSRQAGTPIYIDERSLVVPASVDAFQVWCSYALQGSHDTPPTPAYRIASPGGLSIAFNETACIRWPSALAQRARELAQHLGWLTDDDAPLDTPALFLSAACLVLNTPNYNQLIAVSAEDQLSLTEVEIVSRWSTVIQHYMSALREPTAGIEIDWSQFDDERFEQLCYDIIRECGRYEEWSVRKLGLAKARDGGRDITMCSFREPGKVARWIAQCKFTSSRALGVSRLGPIVDVVVEHEADGYAILTNALVDSTAYDRLTRISQSRGFRLEIWSRLEIERFLGMKPHLRRRHGL